MSLEAVVVKEEREWVNSASECGVSEAAARAGLYAGHQVKDELVVGPECLQPLDVAYTLSAILPRAVAVKSEPAPALRESSVRLGRLADARQGSTASMCARKKADVTKHTGVTVSTEGDSYRCDICEEIFELKPCFIKHVTVHHVQDNEHGRTDNARQPALRDCSVRLERLPAPARPPPRAAPAPARPPPRAAPAPAGERQGTSAARTHTYKCDTCGKTFAYKRCLIKHVQLHLQNTQGHLNRRSPSKKSKMNFQKDIPIQTKTFFCDKCGKQFPRLAALKVHIAIHTREKPFTCKICKKGFTRSDYFNEHSRLHAGQKNYTCEVCGKQFMLLDYLRKHRLVHGGKWGKSFSCEICRKQFKQLWHVTRHKISHEVKKAFTCEVCERQFARSEHFKRHKQIHSGEKPYTCETCQKKFRELHHVTRHKTIHTGQKSHVCLICEKWFSDVGNLKQHKRTHTGVKPHACGKCEKQFVRLDTFKAHTRTHTHEK